MCSTLSEPGCLHQKLKSFKPVNGRTIKKSQAIQQERAALQNTKKDMVRFQWQGSWPPKTMHGRCAGNAVQFSSFSKPLLTLSLVVEEKNGHWIRSTNVGDKTFVSQQLVSKQPPRLRRIRGHKLYGHGTVYNVVLNETSNWANWLNMKSVHDEVLQRSPSL